MAWEAVIYAILSAVVFSLSYYIKSVGEKYEWSKLIATGIVGAGVGVIAVVTNVGNITEQWVLLQLTAYAGTVAIIESWLKIIWRKLINPQGK